MKELFTKEQRKLNKKVWSEYIQKKTPGRPDHHLLYCLMRDIDPRKAFSPIKNPGKLEKRKEQNISPEHSLKIAAQVAMTILINHRTSIRFERNKKGIENPEKADKIALHGWDPQMHTHPYVGDFIIPEDVQEKLIEALKNI